eukprot:Em0003g462a
MTDFSPTSSVTTLQLTAAWHLLLQDTLQGPGVWCVCCESLFRQVFFLVDEAEQAGKGAGVVHDMIELNFMLPGHTKFRPDSYFGLFKKHYRKQDHVDDMADLADCVRQCGQDVTCVPSWASGHPGVMKMKTMPSDTNPIEVTMLRAGVTVQFIRGRFQSQVMPLVIKPSGLSLERSLYLYDKVREYVRDPKKRDSVYLKPPQGTGANPSSTSGQVSSFPGKKIAVVTR